MPKSISNFLPLFSIIRLLPEEPDILTINLLRTSTLLRIFIFSRKKGWCHPPPRYNIAILKLKIHIPLCGFLSLAFGFSRLLLNVIRGRLMFLRNLLKLRIVIVLFDSCIRCIVTL